MNQTVLINNPFCNLAPELIGNGECDQVYNNKDCLYDGGDCCELSARGNPDKVHLGGKTTRNKNESEQI